jgi:dynactin complex subunit
MSTTEETILCNQIALLREHLAASESKGLVLTNENSELKETIANLAGEIENLKGQLGNLGKTPQSRTVDTKNVFRR